MILYLAAFSFILFLAIKTDQDSQNRPLYSLAIWTIFICFVCGFRDMLGGYDSYIYGEVFDVTSNELDRGVPFNQTTAFRLNEKEQGYALLNVLVGYISANRYIFLLIISIITFASLFHHIKNYTKYPHLSFFILFCLLYFFTFTYLRQVLAACIAWYSIPFAVKRKPIHFFLIVALAASFHNSALLFGLTYFISNKRFTKQQIILFLIASLLLGLTPIATTIFDVLGGSVNEEKASGSLSSTGSVRFEYILEAAFFLVLIIYRYDSIAKDKLSTCMLNISLMFMFVLTFFVKFPDGGRMSWFFLIGIASTIAEIAQDENNVATIKFVSITVLSLLFLRVLFAWGPIVTPYKSFLTNGVRENDKVWSMYEYDHNYDNDKFYRPIFKFTASNEDNY
ncbi:MAG: EpsG family protein [Muribaculaceae bacterium]|nr:EpsG family protein [Muribaculaceae bacterium]